jgi:hypothetical protein
MKIYSHNLEEIFLEPISTLRKQERGKNIPTEDTDQK